MRIEIIFSIIVFLAISTEKVFAVTYVDKDVKAWQKICKEFEAAHFRKGEEAYVTYSPIIESTIEEKYWVIEWKDFLIPLTSGEYSSVAIKSIGKDHKSIYLSSDSLGITVSMHYESYPNWRVDIPSIMLDKINPDEFTLNSLTDHSYKITPEDLNCNSNDIISEIKDFSALTLKELVPPGFLASAHRGISDSPGWLTKSTSREQIIWNAKNPVKSKVNTFFSVTYQVKEGSRNSAIGSLLNRKELSSVQKPEWLVSFQEIANKWDKKKLKSLAKENGFRFLDLDSMPVGDELIGRLKELQSNKRGGR